MTRVIVGLVAVVLAATLLIVLHGRQPAANPHVTHQLSYAVPEDHRPFAAKIDGHTFSSMTALKDYLSTLPTGDVVTARIEVPGTAPVARRQEARQVFLDYEQYQQELSDFCKQCHIVFMGSIISA